MAITLLNHVISDLCLGKPALKSLSFSSATVADALSAIKASQENFITIWSCDHTKINRKSNVDDHDHHEIGSLCKCVGKICMVDIICFLCKEDNLKSPSSAPVADPKLRFSESTIGECPQVRAGEPPWLRPCSALFSPVSAIFSHHSHFIKHVDPSTGLLEAIDLILDGAQNLVVPIHTTTSTCSRRKHQKTKGPTTHNGREFCWLTQEDVIRFILSRIGLFTPIPSLSVEELGIIQSKILTVDYHAPAVDALEAIARSLVEQTSVGVLDEQGLFVGEISPFTLCACDETIAAALMTLSTGDLMSYIDWGGPPEDIVRVMKASLKEKKLEGLLEMLADEYSSYSSSTSSSSDDESLSSSSSPSRLARYNRSWSYSARMVRKVEATVCHPKSSLVAVMIQAIAHRVNYVWVMDDDCTPVGIVTFRDMLHVFREHLVSMLKEWDA